MHRDCSTSASDSPANVHEFRNSVGLFGAAQVAALLCGMVVQTAAARWLGVQDYGRFAVVQTVTLATVMLLTSAVPNALRRAVSVDRGAARAAWRRVFVVQGPLCVAAGALLAAAAPWMAASLNDALLCGALRIMAGEVVIRAGVVEPLWQLLNGLRRHALQAVLQGAHGVLRPLCVVSLLACVPAVEAGVTGLLLAVMASAALAVLLVQKAVNESATTPDSGDVDRHMVEWLTFAPAADALNYALVAANLWIVKAFCRDANEVGKYAACYTLAQVLIAMGSALSRASFAPFAALTDRRDGRQAARLVERGMRLAILSAGLVVVAAFGSGDRVMTLLFGPRFDGVGTELGILCAGMSCVSIYWFLCEMLSAGRRLGIRLVSLLALGAVSIPLTWAATSRFGLLGSAWALAGTGLVGLISTGAATRAMIGPFVPWPTLARVSVAAAAAAASTAQLARLLPEARVALPANLLMVTTVYLGVLVAMKEWNLHECSCALRRYGMRVGKSRQ